MAKPPNALAIYPVTGLPLVQPGDDLCALVCAALAQSGMPLADGDVLVVAQKIVSKAEGRLVGLDSVKPSPEALALAVEVDKDPRMVELILQESTQVVRKVPGVLIVRHRLGLVSANAGIDQSNVDHSGQEMALLLPLDPDRSARALRDCLQARTGKLLSVIISDSVNRPWRIGSIGMAIGSSGLAVIDDRRGTGDLFGRELKVTMINRADSIATAAMLVMGETSESVPVAVVRGLPVENSTQVATDSLRPLEEDLFG